MKKKSFSTNKINLRRVEECETAQLGDHSGQSESNSRQGYLK